MSNAKYTYAVARIRALETKLFNQAGIDQLIGCANRGGMHSGAGGKGMGRPGNLRRSGGDTDQRGRENLGDHPGDGGGYVSI